MPILLKYFQKLAEKGTHPNSFYKPTIRLIPNPDKDSTKKEKHRIDNLALHLKQLEKEEQKNPKISRRKEIIRIRAEINEK